MNAISISINVPSLNKVFGIYCIKNIINRHLYIGSATDLNNRRTRHLSELRGGRHKNLHLQRAYDKDGEENFVFEVLKYIPDANKLIKYEQKYIDYFKELYPEYLYNIKPTAGNNLGYHQPEEVKKKIGDAQTGEKNHNYGKTASNETRKKMSESHKNKSNGPMTEEGKKHLSDINKGKKHTQQTKDKMSKTRTGMFAGSKSPVAKLNEDDVINIKEMFKSDKTNKEIGDVFNVSRICIYDIRTGRRWKHVQ